MNPSPLSHPWNHWQQPGQPHQHPQSHQLQQLPQHHGAPHQHHGYGMMGGPAFHQYDTGAMKPLPMIPSPMATTYTSGPHYVSSMPAMKSHFATEAPYPAQYEQPANPMSMHGRFSPPHEALPAASQYNWNTCSPMSRESSVTSNGPGRRRSQPRIAKSLTPPATPDPTKSKDIIYNKPVGREDIQFRTPVDVLMKAIQQKDKKEMAPLTPEASDAEDASYKSEPSSPGAVSECSEGSTKKAKPFVCPYADQGCSYTASQNTHLKTHLCAHTGDKDYHCDWPGCNVSCSQSGNLKVHKRIHTGERPFRCDQCNAAFTAKGNLTAHMRVHSGTKPFICKLEQCGKSFTSNGNLKQHMNRYHKSKVEDLCDWIVGITNIEQLEPADLELVQYMAAVFKNSNKGIKGRGYKHSISGKRMNFNSRPGMAMDSRGGQHERRMASNFERLGI